jgi:hypothetical protein
LISDRFPYYVNHSIEIYSESETELDYDDFFAKLFHKGANIFEINEIFVFLPIVFTRLWLNNINWHETYIEKSEKGTEFEKRYDETESFKIILQISQKYFQNNPSKESIIKIGGRSAEINAINQLLLDGGKLEDVKITKTIIMK